MVMITMMIMLLMLVMMMHDDDDGHDDDYDNYKNDHIGIDKAKCASCYVAELIPISAVLRD